MQTGSDGVQKSQHFCMYVAPYASSKLCNISVFLVALSSRLSPSLAHSLELELELELSVCLFFFFLLLLLLTATCQSKRQAWMKVKRKASAPASRCRVRGQGRTFCRWWTCTCRVIEFRVRLKSFPTGFHELPLKCP